MSTGESVLFWPLNTYTLALFEIILFKGHITLVVGNAVCFGLTLIPLEKE